MTPTLRYHNWTMTPAFARGGPTRPVIVAIDDQLLTQWIGEPAMVWQTPMSEVRNLEIRVGPSLRLAATISGVRYEWNTRRGPEHDAFIEQVRAAGGRVVRSRRRLASTALTVAAVVLVASAASIVSLVHSSAPPATYVSTSDINVQRSDLPAGWSAAPAALLTTIVGPAGEVVRSSTPEPALTGTAKEIWDSISSNFEHCMGVTNSVDRMFGSAGQQPAVQVTGTNFATSSFGGAEIASVTQHYAQLSMVQKDLAEYSRRPFGACWAIASAQILKSELSGKLSDARAAVKATTFSPATFALGFRSGGITVLSIPKFTGTFTLVSIFAAKGHDEVNFYALTANWPAAKPTVLAAFEAVMARLAPTTGSGSA